MAETRQEDRTEQATQKRLDEARRRGQIPRSRELGMAAVLVAGSVVLYTNRGALGADIRALMTRALRFDRVMLDHPEALPAVLGRTFVDALAAFTPLFVTLAMAAVFGSLVIGGWIITPAPLAFKGERLSLSKGLARMFSLNSLVEVLKALARAAVIGGFAFAWFGWSGDTLLRLSQIPVDSAMGTSMTLLLLTFGICSAGVLVIGAVDAPWQLWSYARQQRMTRQEVQDEAKETDGRPEVRSRIRALQQEVARRRMLEAVPTADVVVTNPTHFAVALRYDDSRMRAPVLVAKGTDHVAARIRALASENRVALFEAPLLARALYWRTDIGQEIPGPLYLAVAQVLTYVYRLKAFHQGGAPWPDRPAVQVDEKLAERPQGRNQGRRRRR